MAEAATTQDSPTAPPLGRVTTRRPLARRSADFLLQGVSPILLALLVAGIVIAALGRNPFAFYWDIIDRGLLNPSGLQDTIIRMAPLMLMGVGLIVAFRANIWNIGGDGQFLLAAALVAGLGPLFVGSLPLWLALTSLCVVAIVTGALWTVVPAYLRAYYGVNEIITSLMMTFVGVNLANLLIKGPFRSTTTNVPQTDVVKFENLLPDIPGTRIHIGIIIALIAVVVVYDLMKNTSLGLKLRILGANPRAATHAGLSIPKLTIGAFMASGAFMGLAAAVEILGVWGYMRADWNPNFGLPLFALVFLARLNALAVVPLVGFYAVLSMGGHTAARQADLPDDFMLMIVGLVLLFMALTDYLAERRGSQKSELLSAVRKATGKEDDE